MVTVRRFDVVECVRNGQIKPALVISPDEMNAHLSAVLVAPITKSRRLLPCRIDVRFQSQKGQIALDMIQTFSKKDIIRRLGALPDNTHSEVLSILQIMFSED